MKAVFVFLCVLENNKIDEFLFPLSRMAMSLLIPPLGHVHLNSPR